MAKRPGKDDIDAASGDEPELSRGELVHGKLRDAIRAGRFAPGQRVREAEVAKWLDVSRTPVREAFRRLQADGLLMFEPWRGVVIAELDQQQTIELYAMRKVLEGAAAGLAARHAADSQIDVLIDLVDQADTLADTAELADLNRHFHQSIHAAAHNRYLLKSLNALRDSMALLPSTTYALSERHGPAQEEHREIVTAIKNRDVAKAEAAARKHIDGAERARLKVISDMARHASPPEHKDPSP